MVLSAGDDDAAAAGFLDEPWRLAVEDRVEQPQPTAGQFRTDSRIVALRLDGARGRNGRDQRDPSGEIDRRGAEADRQRAGLVEAQHPLRADLDDPARGRLPDQPVAEDAAPQIEAALEGANGAARRVDQFVLE